MLGDEPVQQQFADSQRANLRARDHVSFVTDSVEQTRDADDIALGEHDRIFIEGADQLDAPLDQREEGVRRGAPVDQILTRFQIDEIGLSDHPRQNRLRHLGKKRHRWQLSQVFGRRSLVEAVDDQRRAVLDLGLGHVEVELGRRGRGHREAQRVIRCGLVCDEWQRVEQEPFGLRDLSRRHRSRNLP